MIERLKEIIFENSFKYSHNADFLLSSGARSHFYFDCKKTTLDPEGAYLIGKILYNKVKDWPITGVGGLTLGADPIASALMHTAWGYGRRIAHFIVRKKLKEHGSIKWIEGILKPGATVIIVEDVITSGDSVIKAIQRSIEDGLNVQGAFILVDREEFEGMKRVQEALPGKHVEALITRSEIMQLYQLLKTK